MNENSYLILGLHIRIENNKKLSKQLKAVAAACLISIVLILSGTEKIENATQSNVLLGNIYWIISIIALIVMYIKDSNCIKDIKKCEIEIYELEVRDLN